MKGGAPVAFSIFLSTLSLFVLLFSILFLIFTRKWSTREIKKIENKKKELEEILLSADQMIVELNKFSDYMISDIEKKVGEVEGLISEIDNKIENRQAAVQEHIDSAEKTRGGPLDLKNQEDKTNMKTIIPLINRAITVNHEKMQTYTRLGTMGSKSLNNLLNSKSKTSQIVSLSEKGFDEAEIARMLNIGRGEVQLILGMRNGTTL